jgi:hypothetical protein
MSPPVLETEINDLPVRRGKVRDILTLVTHFCWSVPIASVPLTGSSPAVSLTREKYIEASETLTGQQFAWK